MTKMGYFGGILAVTLMIRYRAALYPLFLAAALAFLLDLLIVRLEKMLSFPNMRINRSIAICLALLLLFVGIGLIGLCLVPQLKSSVESLTNRLPEHMETLEDFLSGLPLPESVVPDIDALHDLWNRLYSTLLSGAWHITKGLGTVLADSLSVGLTTGVLFLYFLFGKESILQQYRRLTALLPPGTRNHLYRFAHIAREVLIGYLGSRMMESGLLLFFCLPGLWLCRIPHALLFSVLISLGNMIPFLGSLVSTAFCALLLLAIEPIKALWFLLFVLALQQLDNQILYPRIAGNRLGLPAVWSVTAVLIGARIAGGAGAFLGVPVMALLWRLAEEVLEKKQQAT